TFWQPPNDYLCSPQAKASLVPRASSRTYRVPRAVCCDDETSPSDHRWLHTPHLGAQSMSGCSYSFVRPCDTPLLRRSALHCITTRSTESSRLHKAKQSRLHPEA